MNISGATYMLSDTTKIIAMHLGPHQRIEVFDSPFSHFGWIWSDRAIQSYVEGLNRVEYFTSEDSLAIVDKTKLVDQLRIGRRGLVKRRTVLKLP